jgi:hypothetical protein
MTQGQQASPAMMELIVRSAANPEFRESMVENPEEAIKSAGINLSQEELQAISSSSREEREQLMEQLGERSSQVSFAFFEQLFQLFRVEFGFPFFGLWGPD